MVWKYQYTPKLFNYGCLVLGLSMVWHLSHDWGVIFWAFVASIHVTFTIKPVT